MKTRRWVRTLGAIVLVSVVLAACGGAGAGDDSGGSPEISDITLLPVLTPEAVTSLANSDSDAATIGAGYNGAFIAQAWLLTAIVGWSEQAPPTYSSGGYTVEWTRSGSTWCWEIYDVADPGARETWYRICATDTGSGWSIEVRDEIADFTLVDGNISYGGMSGNVTYYDPEISNTYFSVSWGSGAPSWAYEATVTYYVSGVNQGSLVLSFNESATAGSWELYEAGGGLFDYGSWPPS